MAFYTELHAHTSEVSPCSHQTAEQVADRYIAEGYTTVVVANHYCDYVMEKAGSNWDARFAHYVSAYRKMKSYAGDRLNVLLGMELRFTESFNDYLIFGADEAFIESHPNLHEMTLKSFRPLADEHGLLIVQAHPFRNGMKIMPPALVHGVEVFNGHAGHDSRNPLALEWCRRYGKLPTSGSDFHDAESYVAGGILTEEKITSMEQLTSLLRSGKGYTLRCSGPAAERDGLQNMRADRVQNEF